MNIPTMWLIFNQCFLIVAKSDNRYMARRLAVKEMYNKISNTPYPEMTLAIGGECVGLARLRELGIKAMMSATVII